MNQDTDHKGGFGHENPQIVEKQAREAEEREAKASADASASPKEKK